MTTYTQILYHIVFATRRRTPSLLLPQRQDLYGYLAGILNRRHCHPYRIGGEVDHIHILTSVHPTVPLSMLIKTLKDAGRVWIRANKYFPHFIGWQDGYGAFTHSKKEKDRLIEYIKGQIEHHRGDDYLDEYRRLLKEAGIEFDEKYLL